MTVRPRSRVVQLCRLLWLLPLAACATPRATDFKAAEADRWEASNRRVYQFNKRLDRNVIKPISTAYRTVVPPAARHGITNLYSNYGEPANLMNALLQGKISQAFRTLDRFIINSTIGIAGIADNATDLGRPQEREDFGQTFAVWGIDAGPYMVLPLFGPSTLRDSFGLAFDIVIDPADFSRNAAFSPSIYWRIGQLATRVINFRARVTEQGGDALLADSLDEYALVKSIYLQNRRSAIYDGNPPPDPEDDSEFEPEEPETPAPQALAAEPPTAAPAAAAPAASEPAPAPTADTNDAPKPALPARQ
jgi:phospholipid-binding lipoprotein MlaA